jgi:Fe-S-cluster-containing hydrogenase component 2
MSPDLRHAPQVSSLTTLWHTPTPCSCERDGLQVHQYAARDQVVGVCCAVRSRRRPKAGGHERNSTPQPPDPSTHANRSCSKVVPRNERHNMTEAVIKQHLIDPEICIRCNTCESICPVSAITHDSRNYVVDVSKCNWCNDCISPCPTGSIDNYRKVPRARAYSLEEQLGWDELPAELSVAELAALAGEAGRRRGGCCAGRRGPGARGRPHWPDRLQLCAVRHHCCRPGLRRTPTPTSTGPRRPRRLSPPRWPATCASPRSARSTTRTTSCWTSEAMPFPVLEGQSIGIIPPGTDAEGRHAPCAPVQRLPARATASGRATTTFR